MAQYFYDLSLVNPLEPDWPYLAKGNRPNVDSLSELGKRILDRSDPAFYYLTAPNADTHRWYSLGVSFQDLEILMKTRVLRVASSTYTNTGPGFAFRVQDTPGTYLGRSDNSYYVSTGAGSPSSRDNLNFYKLEGGSQTKVQDANGALPTKDDDEILLVDQFIRAQISGNTFKVRSWYSEESEPASWDIDTTDSTHPDAGDVAICCHKYSYGLAQYFISIGTEGDPTPDSLSRLVSGTVTKPDDTAADGYLVRCYHRPTGALLGETLTSASGLFTFDLSIPETEEVYCVAVDQVGNTWNIAVEDRINPII